MSVLEQFTRTTGQAHKVPGIHNGHEKYECGWPFKGISFENLKKTFKTTFVQTTMSFPPQTHEHCSQEMSEVTGNLDRNISKSVCLFKALHFSTELCLIPLNIVNI